MRQPHTFASVLALYLESQRRPDRDRTLLCAFFSALKTLSPAARTAVESAISTRDWLAENAERAARGLGRVAA